MHTSKYSVGTPIKYSIFSKKHEVVLGNLKYIETVSIKTIYFSRRFHFYMTLWVLWEVLTRTIVKIGVRLRPFRDKEKVNCACKGRDKQVSQSL